LITRIIFGEERESRSSSLCTFLHCPVIPSLWRSDIFLSTILAKNSASRFADVCHRIQLCGNVMSACQSCTVRALGVGSCCTYRWTPIWRKKQLHDKSFALSTLAVTLRTEGEVMAICIMPASRQATTFLHQKRYAQPKYPKHQMGISRRNTT